MDVEPAIDDFQIRAGNRFTREVFDNVGIITTNGQLILRRIGLPRRSGRSDRGKASVYGTFETATGSAALHPAERPGAVPSWRKRNEQERATDPGGDFFHLLREEIVERVEAGKLGKKALAAYDYVYDVFPDRAGN